MSQSVTGMDHDEPTEAVSGWSDPSRFEPAPGSSLGRYLVVEAAGRGAMGTVLRGYDSKLQREVALKLVGAHVDADSVARVVREAQAMAKLNHPNVVAVHDVEQLQRGPDQPSLCFIVMEYVAGRTMRAWLRDSSPSKEAILAAFSQAGAGLAAAHAAGLVHRDFKPSNVLMGDDGRVRVTDFGIVRLGPGSQSSVDSVDDSAQWVPGDDLTRVGTVLGTPSYMAPEQHTGSDVDARADVYGFCVALYEALHGRRPFSGETLAELIGKKRAGLPSSAASDGVPGWIDRILARGLAPRQADRWPTMNALLAALERDPRRTRRRWLALGGVGVAGAGLLGMAKLDEARLAEACISEAQGVAEVWNSQRRGDLTVAFESDGRAFAAVLGDKVVARIDRYAQTWSELAEQTCLAEANRQGQTSLDPRACLDERLVALEQLIETLHTLDRNSMPAALDAALQLPRLEDCQDETALRHDAQLATVDLEVRRKIRNLGNRALVMSSANRYDEALEVADEAVGLAQKHDAAGLLAEALYRRGKIHEANGDFKNAASDLREAYWKAGERRLDRLAAAASINLVGVEGIALGHRDRGDDWVRDAQTALARSGQGTELLQARLERRHAALLAHSYEAKASLEHQERALAIFEEHFGPRSPFVATTYGAKALNLLALGRVEEATEMMERALELQRTLYGDAHPAVGVTLTDLAQIELQSGQLDAAVEHVELALELMSAVYGPRHPELAKARAVRGGAASNQGDYERALREFTIVKQVYADSMGPRTAAVANSMNNLAVVYKNLGRFDEAIEQYENALEIMEEVGGEDSLGTIAPLMNLGRLHRVRGQYEQALEKLDRAIALAEGAYPGAHQDKANAYIGKGSILVALGRSDEALTWYERAVADEEALHGPDSVSTAYALSGLGSVKLSMGEATEAVEVLERAHRLLAIEETYGPRRAYVDFSLAKALVEADVDLARARELAERALSVLEGTHGDVDAADAAQVRAWLDSHRELPKPP